MKTTLFSTVSAIALSGLCLTLTPTTLSAKGSSHGGHSSGGHASRGGSHGGGKTSRTSSRGSSRGCKTASRGGHDRGGHGRTCSHLPSGCRGAHYHGRNCYYGGGHYWGACPDGSYEILDTTPDVETDVVDTTPVYTTPVVATADDDSDDTAVVSVLPADCETVYVGGERCWYHDGCYYHRSGHGYSRTRCHDGGHGRNCGTRGRGNRGGRSCSRGNQWRWTQWRSQQRSQWWP